MGVSMVAVGFGEGWGRAATWGHCPAGGRELVDRSAPEV